MGYKILGDVADVLEGYEARLGLEGPFVFAGRVLYYSTSEGKYWDPKTDFFLSQEEMSALTEKNFV